LSEVLIRCGETPGEATEEAEWVGFFIAKGRKGEIAKFGGVEKVWAVGKSGRGGMKRGDKNMADKKMGYREVWWGKSFSGVVVEVVGYFAELPHREIGVPGRMKAEPGNKFISPRKIPTPTWIFGLILLRWINNSRGFGLRGGGSPWADGAGKSNPNEAALLCFLLSLPPKAIALRGPFSVGIFPLVLFRRFKMRLGLAFFIDSWGKRKVSRKDAKALRIRKEGWQGFWNVREENPLCAFASLCEIDC
jgi:hypothetical protein